MATHTLYKYIWQHSRRDQITLLVIALAAQPIYFLTLTLPKLIVNGPIQGKGFETPDATQNFLQGRREPLEIGAYGDKLLYLRVMPDSHLLVHRALRQISIGPKSYRQRPDVTKGNETKKEPGGRF